MSSKKTEGEASLGSTPKFVPSKEIKILAFDGERQVEQAEDGKVYRFVSSGMGRRGLPELEVVDVPVDLAGAAAMLINNVADYIANHKQISNGQTWATDLGPAMIGARCFEFDRGGQKWLRIEDVSGDGSGKPPLMALVSFLYVKAMLAIEGDGHHDAAIEDLKLAVKEFPGTPSQRAYKFPKPLFNQENHLAYLALANAESGDSTWYQKAVERSDVLERYELGANSLTDLPRETLVRDAIEIVKSAQTSQGGEAWGEAKVREAEASKGAGIMAFLVSPIPGPGGRTMNAAPVPFRRYFYEKPVADQLRSESIAGLAADVYLHYRTKTVEFLLLIRDTRELYEGHVDSKTAHGVQEAGGPPRAPGSGAYKDHYRMLGSVLADIGRKLAAGLTVEEIREQYRLAPGNHHEKSIHDKLAIQGELERKYMLAAIGM